MLAITHTHPTNLDDAIDIPPATKRRLGLDDERSCIVFTESNRFVWPGPDVRAIDSGTAYFGPLPPALFTEVKRRFVELARAQRQRAPARSESSPEFSCRQTNGADSILLIPPDTVFPDSPDLP